MTILEFKAAAKKSKTNTNNAWGFGGSINKYYTLGGLQIRAAEFCYRHRASDKATLYYRLGPDSSATEISKKQFELLIEKI